MGRRWDSGDIRFILTGGLWGVRSSAEFGDTTLSFHPARYRWSSARYHLGRRHGDALCAGERFDFAADEWRALLRIGLERLMIKRIEKHLSTGRPLGDEEFVKELERQLGRTLRPRRPGPPKGFKRRRRRRRR